MGTLVIGIDNDSQLYKKDNAVQRRGESA